MKRYRRTTKLKHMTVSRFYAEKDCKASYAIARVSNIDTNSQTVAILDEWYNFKMSFKHSKRQKLIWIDKLEIYDNRGCGLFKHLINDVITYLRKHIPIELHNKTVIGLEAYSMDTYAGPCSIKLVEIYQKHGFKLRSLNAFVMTNTLDKLKILK